MFIVGYLLVALTFLAVGLCLLISPSTHFGLLDRMARVDFWAQSGSSWNPKAPRWRALGAAFILFSLLLIFGPPLAVYIHSPEDLHKHVQPSSSNPSWGAIIVMLFFLALGVGFVAKPLAVLNKVSARKFPAEPDTLRSTYKLRIIGSLLLLASLLGIWAQFFRHFRLIR